eukprot:47115-Prorocentrum_minimum.AAC.2
MQGTRTYFKPLSSQFVTKRLHITRNFAENAFGLCRPLARGRARRAPLVGRTPPLWRGGRVVHAPERSLATAREGGEQGWKTGWVAKPHAC